MARSIAEKPHLFILDNFLLNLKSDDQDLLVDALVGKNKFWTLLGASNNAKFAKKCDRIIVLDEGKILDQGTYDYISKQPYFKDLFHSS